MKINAVATVILWQTRVTGDDGWRPVYLITKRAATKKNFPNKWTVPGGHLDEKDFDVPPTTDLYWYGIMERVAKREVWEETSIGLVGRLMLETTLASRDSLILSYSARVPLGTEVRLNPAEASDYRWVTLDEAKDFDLIEGIIDELAQVEQACQ